MGNDAAVDMIVPQDVQNFTEALLCVLVIVICAVLLVYNRAKKPALLVAKMLLLAALIVGAMLHLIDIIVMYAIEWKT